MTQKPYVLKLRAPGNPDFQQYAPIALPKDVPIDSIEDAPPICRKYISDYGLGGGNWGDGAGDVVEVATGKVVARVSYRGAIWRPAEDGLSLEDAFRKLVFICTGFMQQEDIAKHWKPVTGCSDDSVDSSARYVRDDGLVMDLYFPLDMFDPVNTRLAKLHVSFFARNQQPKPSNIEIDISSPDDERRAIDLIVQALTIQPEPQQTGPKVVIASATITYTYSKVVELEVPEGVSEKEYAKQHFQERYGDILAAFPYDGSESLYGDIEITGIRHT